MRLLLCWFGVWHFFDYLKKLPVELKKIGFDLNVAVAVFYLCVFSLAYFWSLLENLRFLLIGELVKLP